MSSKQQKAPAKKPSGGRPIAQRLFSKDSSTYSSSSGDESGRPTTRPPLAALPESTEVGRATPWASDDIVSSPASSTGDLAEHYFVDPSPSTSSAQSSSSSVPLHAPVPRRGRRTKLSFDTDAPGSPPPLSPSKLRWEHLRQHVMPSVTSVSSKLSSTSNAAVASSLPTVTSPTPSSFSSFSQLNVPVGSNTPKPSRFPRFGFRQVVAEARVVADDLTRRASEEIHRACWAVRFDETVKSKSVQKFEREASQGAFSSALSLPMKSTTSLPLSNASSANLPSFGALKRPPSMVTLAQTNSGRSTALANLQTVIVRYASVAKQKETSYLYLPHEREVLSAVLIVFLSQSTGRIADDERRLSMEIFETIIRTWRTPLPDGEIDRCLWCCKAATMPASPLRSRVLLNLTFLLSREPLLTTPVSFRTVVPSIALLIPSYTQSPDSESDLLTVKHLLSEIVAGRCGRLDLSDLEQKYNAIALKPDTEDDLRRGICLDALLRSLEVGSPTQQHLLHRSIEDYWQEPDISVPYTPLRTKIHVGKINTFLRAAARLLHQLSDLDVLSEFSAASAPILRMLSFRVLPELDSMGDEVRESRRLAVKVAMALACVDSVERFQAAEFLIGWLENSFWRQCVEDEMKELATAAEWLTVIRIADATLDVLPTDIKKTLSGLMISQFHERLVSEPPPHPCEALSDLFRTFAHVNPQVFYKPLFTCAASAKELIIAHHLTILIAIGRYLPDFWTTDAEMIAVATMSDISAARKGKQKANDLPSWGQARPGQCVVLLEVIGALRNARKELKENSVVATESHVKVVKFATSLEARLTVWLGAREQTSLLPLSHRCLIAMLLLEIRLITRSLRSAQWLRNVVSWTVQFHGSHQLQTVSSDVEAEMLETRDVIHIIWHSAKEGLRPHKHRRSTVVLSPKLDAVHSNGPPEPYDASFDARLSLLNVLEGPPIRQLLELLVAMSGALSKENYVELGPGLWEDCLESEDAKTAIYASFLSMQCAEKAAFEFLQMINDDFKSNNNVARRRAVIRMGALSSWRFQLLSLTYITDKTHRRPFKLARPPIAFVATDVGSANYVHVLSIDDAHQQRGPVLPPDLRRRLSEIGWTNEDEPMDQLLEWLRTPMSLLAANQLDNMSKHSDVDVVTPEIGRSGSPSPASSPGKSPRGGGNLLRRNSSSGGHQNIKRRPVLVQPLLSIFLHLAALALDVDFSVASLARDLLLDFMRDDPTVLCRAIMESISEGKDSLDTAVVALRSFLWIGKTLPPRLTHHVFGHLAGFLKYLAREVDTPDAFRQLAHVIPSLAKYAPQVSDLSVQAVRRAKIEVFLFPSGQLWFPESAPQSAMFPKGPVQNTNPFEEVSSSLIHMLTIRTSQNMLFVELIRRTPSDVHFLRKSWTHLVLPSVNGSSETDSTTHMDITRELNKTSTRTGELDTISLSFCRSHLSLVAQTLRCLTRHLNDRSELEMILDGVNRILLRHADDIGIVGQALIVYMIASTRFRRLMTASGGFSLFMSVLIKVYCESEGNIGVKEAIEYSVHKFFAVHEEAFVFQSLDVASTLVHSSTGDNEWLAGCVYSLLSSLKSAPPPTADSAGIRDVNKQQEEETALAITADERPQFFLATLTAKGKIGADKIESSLSAGIFDNKKFGPDNIVRLLLTVIGHDPSSKRAERFLRLFRYMAPHFYNASTSARTVLRDGMAAVGTMLFSKLSGKYKNADPISAKPDAGQRLEDASTPQGQSKNQSHVQTAGDPQTMRADYILAFAAYVKTGGQIRAEAFRMAASLAIVLLKDSASSKTVSASDCVSTFMSMIGEGLCSREDLKLTTSLLKELVPIINLHGSSLDFTGFLKALTTMSSNPVFANDESFSTVVVRQICPPIFDLCEAVAEDNLVSTLPFHSALVSFLSHSVGLLGSDIMSEIEKLEPNIGVLTGLVLPLASTLLTTSDLTIETQWTDSRRQDAHARAWIRLAAIASKAFHSLTSPGNTKTRSTSVSDVLSPSTSEKSGKKTKNSMEDVERVAARCVVSLITLKLVIVRGEDDMTAVMPDVWMRLGVMLRSLLDDGSATFAFRKMLPSPNVSPLPSPMVDQFTDKFMMDKSAHRRTGSSEDKDNLNVMLRPDRPLSSVPPSPTSPSVARHTSERIGASEPRIVDYLLWSFLEFVCRRRSPLTLQLRTFMHEKLVPLHESLRSVNAGTDLGLNSRARRSLRPISTIFSKPRMSMAMGFRSTGPSPDASPRLGPSESTALRASIPPSLSLDVSELSRPPLQSPGHTPANSLKRRIVHLGPQFRANSPTFISPSSTTESISSSKKGSEGGKGSSDVRKIISLARVRSRVLQQRTYERVRIVQACSGYRTLLSSPIQTISTRSNSLDAPGSSDHGFERFSRLGGMPSVASPRASAEFGLESEPDVAAWTKGQAVGVLLDEAREFVEAWESGLIHVSAGSVELTQSEEGVPTGSVEGGPTPYASVSSHGVIGLGLG